MQRLVDALTITGFVTAFVQGVETSRFGQYKALVFHHLFDEFRLVAVLGLVAIVVILPYIGDVLEKQHGEDEVFVSIGADGATEGIAGVPQRFVDAVLVNLVVHPLLPFMWGQSMAGPVQVLNSLCRLFSGHAPGISRWRLRPSCAHRCLLASVSASALHPKCWPSQ